MFSAVSSGISLADETEVIVSSRSCAAGWGYFSSQALLPAHTRASSVFPPLHQMIPVDGFPVCAGAGSRIISEHKCVV